MQTAWLQQPGQTCSMTGQRLLGQAAVSAPWTRGVPACSWAGLVDKRRGQCRCRLSMLGHGLHQPPGRALSWRPEPGQTLWRPLKLLTQNCLQTNTGQFGMSTKLTAAKVTGDNK